MAKVYVYYAPGNKRSQLIAEAAYKGLRSIGERAVIRKPNQHTKVDADYAVFYGLSCGLDRIMHDYKISETARAVYVDLGWWHRRLNDRFDGYHKISVDSRHPTAYFDAEDMPSDRFEALGLEIKPWRTKGDKVIVASMSQKAAKAEGLIPYKWETEALHELKKYTTKQICYKPKPNDMRCRPIPGFTWFKEKNLLRAFQNVHAVVARHSNICVDAILEGIPVYCEGGVALPMSMNSISEIEVPFQPKDREQWAWNIAYQQWTPKEMKSGDPWAYLKEIGVLP